MSVRVLSSACTHAYSPDVVTDKLARIKAKAKPHTLRKASITAEQLQRRYAVLLAPPKAKKPQVTLLGAARWYSKQESVVQASLDNAEPLTWLKHLLEKRGKRAARLPWHLSALIIEEYAKTFARLEPMQTIPEDGAMSDSTHAPDSSPFVISVVSPKGGSASKTPSSDSWSWSPPPQALEPSLSRKRHGHAQGSGDDGQVSFEPQVDSGRESVGPDSRRSSIDPLNVKNQPNAYNTDSTRSSVYSSMFSASRGLAMSPASSRMQFRDFAKRMRRRPGANGSEEALSSAHNSVSEHSHEDDGATSSPQHKSRSRPMSLTLKSPKSPRDAMMSEGDRAALSDKLSSSGEGPMTAKQGLSPDIVPAEPTAKAMELSIPADRRESLTPVKRYRRSTDARRRRMSLSSLDRIILQEQQKQLQQADEEAERHEYDQKTQ